jgi:hypothetical protein
MISHQTCDYTGCCLPAKHKVKFVNDCDETEIRFLCNVHFRNQDRFEKRQIIDVERI